MKILSGILLTGSWIETSLKSIFLLIDSVVFSILEGIVRLVFMVGNFPVDQLTQNLSFIFNNIKSLVGIFIIFKLSLLFIQYLIEPDSFKDKAKGGEAVVKNVLVVSILLVLLNSNLLFETFHDMQKVIFGSGGSYQVLDKIGISPSSEDGDMIQKLVFGKTSSDPSHTVAVKIFEQFLFQYEGELDKSTFVPKPWDSGEPGLSSNDASQIFAVTALENVPFLYLTQHSDFIGKDKNVQYIIVLSTAFAIYMIIKFGYIALSLIGRAFKLFVLEIISPIAIVSYATPDGKSTFNNFWKTYFSTYLELFVRLFIVYLSIHLMGTFLNSMSSFTELNGITLNWITRLALTIIILIGISKFMEELPNLIGSVFGLKMDTPKQKSFGAMIGGIIGGGIGAGIGFSAAKAAGIKGLGAVANAGMGLFGGAKSGSSSQNLGAFVSGQIANATKSVGRGYDILQSGGKLGNYMQLQADKMLGGENAIKREYGKLNDDVAFYGDKASSIAEVDNAGQIDYAKGFIANLGSDKGIYDKYEKFNTLDEIANFEAGAVYSDAEIAFNNGQTEPFTFINKITGKEETVTRENIYSTKEAFKNSQFNAHKSKARKATSDYIGRMDSGNLTDADKARTKTYAAYEKGKARVDKYNSEWGANEEFISNTEMKEGAYRFGDLEDAAKGEQAKATGRLREFMGDQRNRNIISGGGKGK